MPDPNNPTPGMPADQWSAMQQRLQQFQPPSGDQMQAMMARLGNGPPPMPQGMGGAPGGGGT